MTITLSLLIEVGAAVAVIATLFKTSFKFYELIKHQEEQDEAIKDIKEELALILDGMHATLDGLEQQGCNHTVPATKEKLYNHLNKQSHKYN